MTQIVKQHIVGFLCACFVVTCAVGVGELRRDVKCTIDSRFDDRSIADADSELVFLDRYFTDRDLVACDSDRDLAYVATQAPPPTRWTVRTYSTRKLDVPTYQDRVVVAQEVYASVGDADGRIRELNTAHSPYPRGFSPRDYAVRWFQVSSRVYLVKVDRIDFTLRIPDIWNDLESAMKTHNGLQNRG